MPLFHVGIVKPLLLSLIKNEGASTVLVGWQGTDAEAIEAVEADPRSVFVLDAKCRDWKEDGSCRGHKVGG